ncbi:hypothetical protein CAI21_22180 [Alkalilimnicola ehrlichii]|uniref:Uncharacterized protein n=1 Tax=Alkalilimnicola ehrlichii TaxID=351052 RepID=A0A3E0WFN8_9GAMM|nr:hypothetical protein [Alkalilimnicola ehrlichii]RFA24313.1 hypothetical protein CAI21_22180 [Alkalilimnicola ehrlichii]RFA31548.1 hypothetical protein CAL65_22270 [Alkalilimnicola ehrlichii]
MKRFGPWFGVFLVLLLASMPLWASIQLPSYAQTGNAEQQAQQIGGRVTDFILLVAAMLGVIGLASSACFLAIGNRETAKNLFLAALALLFFSFLFGASFVW